MYFSIQYFSNRFYCRLLFTKQILIVCPALIPQFSLLFACIFQHRGGEVGRRDASESPHGLEVPHGSALVKMQTGGRAVQGVTLQRTSPWINGTLLSCVLLFETIWCGPMCMNQWSSKTWVSFLTSSLLGRQVGCGVVARWHRSNDLSSLNRFFHQPQTQENWKQIPDGVGLVNGGHYGPWRCWAPGYRSTLTFRLKREWPIWFSLVPSGARSLPRQRNPHTTWKQFFFFF